MNLKDRYFPVLDHGFIALKDYMGSDIDIEQAARISYQKGTRKKTDTEGLIRYLVSHGHTSPLEMAELKFHIRIPMDCWRQWIRHRTASVNEYSTRYSKAINLRQQTKTTEWRKQAKNNKQGSDGYIDKLDKSNGISGQELTIKEFIFHEEATKLYNERLRAGVAREQARKDLPLSTYTEAFWKIDLHNLLHFLKLRCDTHAQYEIRQYANIIAGITQQLFPITFQAWLDYVFNAVMFSSMEMKLLEYYMSCVTKIDNFDDQLAVMALTVFNMSKREYKEFFNKLEIKANKKFNLDLSTSKPYSYFTESEQ